jgi:Tol biopolymer transport system component
MKSLGIYISIILTLTVADNAVSRSQTQSRLRPRSVTSPRAELSLKNVPFKIVHETYRQTKDRQNWELFLINADGSNPLNLTNTPDVDEMYPHVSPDGTKICFVADEGTGRKKVRSVYYMNIDGTERFKVASNARQPCWNFDGKKIAYLPGEYER